jgi:four helix bundle protein
VRSLPFFLLQIELLQILNWGVMDSGELLERLKQFAYRIVKMAKSLSDFSEGGIVKKQILRSAFSAAANYRSACKAYSKKAFSAKLGISFEELDETVFWLDIIGDIGLIKKELLTLLRDEGEQLCKILAKSLITARRTKSAI